MNHIQSTDNTKTILEFKKVSFAYEPDHPVINDISYQIKEGDCVGLIGANGAGKSTIMKLLLGLQFGSGEISIDGISVNKSNLAEIRKKVGFVLQTSDHQMFMPTVYDDMLFGPMNYGMTREKAETQVDRVLDALHIPEIKHKYNHKISGGEKRMASIATVLAMNPDILVMDEPSASLDPYNRRQIIKVIQDLPQTKLIGSHDLDMIYELCNRVILIWDGRVVAYGPTEEILSDQKLLEENHLELPYRFMK